MSTTNSSSDISPKLAGILITLLAIFAVSCIVGAVLLLPIHFLVGTLVGLCGLFLGVLGITGYVTEFHDKD